MDNKLISDKVFSFLFPMGNKTVQPLLNKLLPENNIDTLSRVSSFLSQCGHESAGFTRFKENLNYSASGLLDTFPKYFNYSSAVLYERNPEAIANRVYANRMGNGPEESGDGWKYRGRGLIQLTGKNNYQEFAKYKGISLDQTVMYLDTLQGQVESSIWYWNTFNLNKFSDIEDVRGLTKAINGGYKGLEHREELFINAKRLLTDFLGKGKDFKIKSIHFNKPRIKVSKDFYRDQFECSPIECSCGYDYIDFEIVNIVQTIFNTIQREINIISGTRCIQYNKIVGIEGSLHLIGKAVDIEVPEDKNKKLLAMKSNDIINLIKSLFKDVYCYTIDEYKVHIDIRNKNNPRSIKVLRNITRADLMSEDGIDSLDISIYLVLKTFLKTIDRNIKIIPIKRVEGRLNKSISFQIPSDNNKNLPEMKSDEIINILNKLFGNLLILQKIDEFTVFINFDKI